MQSSSPNSTFSHLLSSGRIGTLELKNRMFVTAMGVSLADDDGTCGERLIAYHEEQAKGARGDSTLANLLREAGLTVREIGDGTGIGYIEGAIRGAAHAAQIG